MTLVMCFLVAAKIDLGIGASCDEIDERRYCGKGLVCHKCSGHFFYSCVHCKHFKHFFLNFWILHVKLHINSWNSVDVNGIIKYVFQSHPPDSKGTLQNTSIVQESWVYIMIYWCLLLLYTSSKYDINGMYETSPMGEGNTASRNLVILI